MMCANANERWPVRILTSNERSNTLTKFSARFKSLLFVITSLDFLIAVTLVAVGEEVFRSSELNRRVVFI